MLENPLIPPSTVLMLLSKGRKQDIKGLRSGTVDISNYDKAIEIVSVLNDFLNIVDFAFTKNFVIAVMNMMHIPGYDHDIMTRKLEYQSRSVVKCVNVRQYMEMFDEIYNHNQSKNRLTIK